MISVVGLRCNDFVVVSGSGALLFWVWLVVAWGVLFGILWFCVLSDLLVA